MTGRIGGFGALGWLILMAPLAAHTGPFDSLRPTTAHAAPLAQDRPFSLRPAHAAQLAQGRSLGAATSRDVAAGQQIFDAQCAWCHGAAGTGGTGPDLRRPTLRHATTDASLTNIVRNGIPGTEMPSFAIALTDTMAWQTAAYVRSLGRTRSAPVAGDAARGARLYESSGCGGCHVVSGRGGVLGPELTSIGAQRGAPYLREALVKPAAAHPPGYMVVRAVPASGAEMRGIRVNEDVFYVHIRDAGGTLHTIEKAQLARLDRELDGTLMPSYESRLSATEIDDVVAWLATLRGTK